MKTNTDNSTRAIVDELFLYLYAFGLAGFVAIVILVLSLTFK